MLSDGQIYLAYYLEFSSIDRNNGQLTGLQYFSIDTNELTILSTQLHYQQLNGPEQRCYQSYMEIEVIIWKHFNHWGGLLLEDQLNRCA